MLKVGQSTSQSSSGSNKVAEGVYGKKGIITGCKQIPNQKLGTYEPDVYIDFTVKSGDYNNTVSVFGSFNRDKQSQKVTGWGLAAKVDKTFARLGAYEGLTDEEKNLNGVMFNDKVLEAVIGKPVYMLSYVIGKRRDADKPAYRNFWYLMPEQEGASDEDHYAAIWEAFQADDYATKGLREGQAYLQESSSRYLASKANEPSSSGSTNDLMF
jgi:hypothetical protein